MCFAGNEKGNFFCSSTTGRVTLIACIVICKAYPPKLAAYNMTIIIHGFIAKMSEALEEGNAEHI